MSGHIFKLILRKHVRNADIYEKYLKGQKDKYYSLVLHTKNIMHSFHNFRIFNFLD